MKTPKQKLNLKRNKSIKLSTWRDIILPYQYNEFARNPGNREIGSQLRIKFPQDYMINKGKTLMSKLTDLSEKEKFERNQRMMCITEACTLIGKQSAISKASADNPVAVAKQLYKFVKKGK